MQLLSIKIDPVLLFIGASLSAQVLSTFAHAKQSALVVDAGHCEITGTWALVKFYVYRHLWWAANTMKS